MEHRHPLLAACAIAAAITLASSTSRADPPTATWPTPSAAPEPPPPPPKPTPPPRDAAIVNDAPSPAPPPMEPDEAAPPPKPGERFLHGFRFGYGYVMNYQKPVPAFGGKSLAEKVNMRTPSQFLLGYEAMYRLTGHSWLNVILVGNVVLAGLEQSEFYPTANGILGFEFNHSFQVGVGTSLQPLEGSIAHAIVAAGWTPRVGSFYIPVHGFFVPDVDGVNRMGVTTGVTW